MADPTETTVPVHLGYFPSVYHAAVFRNWDIVPLNDLARVLETTSGAVLESGVRLGLKPPPALTPEAQRRNYETVLRRNWPVMPRAQIEALLHWKPADLDHFLATDIAFRVLLGAPPPDLVAVKYEPPTSTTLARCDWFRQQVEKHRAAVADVKEEARFTFIEDLLQPHKDGERDPAMAAGANDADLTKGWTLLIPADAGPVCLTFAEDFAEYCRTVQGAANLSITIGTAEHEGALHTIQLTVSKTGDENEESYRLEIGPERIQIMGTTDRALARALIELEHRMAERGGPFLAATNEKQQCGFARVTISR